MKKEKEVKTLKTLLIWLTCLIAVGGIDGGLSLGISEGIYFFLGVGIIICLVWSLRIVFRLNK